MEVACTSQWENRLLHLPAAEEVHLENLVMKIHQKLQ